jgi:hypothetical protein
MAGFGISNAKPSSSATTDLVSKILRLKKDFKYLL